MKGKVQMLGERNSKRKSKWKVQVVEEEGAESASMSSIRRWVWLS